MSTATKAATKVRAVNLKSGPTPAQRAWVKKLGGIELPVLEPEAAELENAKAPRGDRKELVGFGPADIPGLLAKTLLGPLSVTCMINNNTQQTLQLDPKSRDEIDDDSGKTMGIAHGEYKEFPPSLIKGEDQTAKFVAVNKTQSIIIADIHTAGVEGFVKYFLDDQKTAWVLHFNNPRAGSNTAAARIEGPNAAAVAQFATPKPVAGGGDDAKFLFVLDRKGGSGPAPKPTPDGVDLAASCAITVTNKTNLVLTLTDQGHDRGDFMTFPAPSLEPGASTSFVSIETPNSAEEGCKGFLTWEVGSPATAIWRVEWDNAEKAKNTAKGTLEPQTGGFRSLEQIGQGDENVPVVFALSGGGGGSTPPPNPKPEPEPDFVPPVEARQPTLRKGDKGVDGWVEYLQNALNFHLKTNLALDGDFGSGTLKAVIAFQKKKNLQVDGTVGNQTWAALREGMPEKPSTDGRKPHTHVEEGAEARWDLESELDNGYDKKTDEFGLGVTSVGNQKIDEFQATVRITPPGTKPKVVKVKIGPPVETTGTGAGGEYVVLIPNFKKTFPAADPNAKITDYLVEAYLPQELGGDFYSGKIREI